jgi:hypothetical protein
MTAGPGGYRLDVDARIHSSIRRSRIGIAAASRVGP